MAYANSSSKKRKLLETQRGEISKLTEKNMCDCDHTKKNGDPDLFQSNNRKPGEIKYICRACDKEINLKRIPDDTLKEACKTIENACDLIKLSLNLEREADQKIQEKVSVLQYRVRNNLEKWYGAALSRNKGGNRNNRNQNSNSSISKPRVY